MESVLYIDYYAEACGVDGGGIYIFNDGEKLIEAMATYSCQASTTLAPRDMLLIVLLLDVKPVSDTSLVLGSPLRSCCKTLVCTQTVTLNNRPASHKCQPFKSHTGQRCVPERECFITA